MKKVLLTIIALSSFVYAFDMGAVADSVDGQKAKESVDQEKVSPRRYQQGIDVGSPIRSWLSVHC